jgi:hypothetical protein
MHEYITNYLDQLQQALADRVGAQYHSLKHSIDSIDRMMTKMEQEMDQQEANIKQIMGESRAQAEREVQAAEHLLKNVKGSFRVQKEKLDVDQERLIKEIQSILKNDGLQWDQIKTQVKYRLHTLESFDQIKDYAEAFVEVADMVEREERDRHNDDQQIIDMLNHICIKIYSKIADENTQK